MTCTAHRSGDKNPCRAKAIKGGTVCAVHGGRAPQVKAKAQQRLLMAADRMAGVLVEIATKRTAPEPARVSAATAVLDRAGLSVKQLVEHSGPDGGAIQVELVARLQSARERLRRISADPSIEKT